MAAQEVQVHLAVFNYGSFRTVATRRTDETGLAEFVTGPGQMLVSAGTDELGAAAVVTASPDEPSVTILRLSDEGMELPDPIWLHYPVDK